MSYQVHWNEGLFLQPHHFQQMQRGVFALLEKMRVRAFPYGYGITEIDDLIVGTLRSLAKADDPTVVDADDSRPDDLAGVDVE